MRALLGSLAAALLAAAACADAQQRPPEFGPGVYVGYQGWFHAAGDGCGLGFRHYGRDGRFEPGRCSVDYWPDMSECADDERYETPFVRADGSRAHVFSSANAQTVRRHFGWMAAHDIDGAFAQRFGASLRTDRMRAARDRVLANVRAGAAAHGRAWALMYDLSGLRAGEVEAVVAADFRRLHRDGVFADPHYLRFGGRPLVAVWGVGFADGRAYSLAECAALVDVLHDDPEVGGNAVMLGVPHGFREGDRDAVDDPALQALTARVEVLSPWSVGRYRDLAEVRRNRARHLEPDLAWCRARRRPLPPGRLPRLQLAQPQTRPRPRSPPRPDPAAGRAAAVAAGAGRAPRRRRDRLRGDVRRARRRHRDLQGRRSAAGRRVAVPGLR